MICSVRSEILTAIQRFIVTKEINKVTSGFSVPLNWNYTNNNSYAHPIIQILLKRIAVCAELYYIYGRMVVKQAVEKRGISDWRIRVLCVEGKSTGVYQEGLGWKNTADVEKLADGKYKYKESILAQINRKRLNLTAVGR